MSNTTPQKPSITERHIQTIVGAILVTLILWVGVTVTSNKESIAVLQVQVQTLQGAINTASLDYYSKSEAEKDLRILSNRIDRLEGRFND